MLNLLRQLKIWHVIEHKQLLIKSFRFFKDLFFLLKMFYLTFMKSLFSLFNLVANCSKSRVTEKLYIDEFIVTQCCLYPPDLLRRLSGKIMQAVSRGSKILFLFSSAGILDLEIKI